MTYDLLPMNNTQLISPLTRYQRDIEENEFTFDEAQHKAIEQLDILFHQLIETERTSKNCVSFFEIL